jgi:purine-cytosine permease-like protein
VTAPLALLGTRTGTNNTVSSGAHFRVTGRLVGTPTGDGALAIGYALIAVEIATVALYGHATVVALQKIVVPVVGVLLLLGIPAFAGGFDAARARADAHGRVIAGSAAPATVPAS